MQDHEIIAMIRERKYHGLEQLMAVYGESMLRTIHRVLCHPHEISERQDVANEVFYEVWRNIDSYDPKKSSLMTWLLMVSRSRAIDRKRKRTPIGKEIDICEWHNSEIYQSPLEKEQFLCLIDTLDEIDQKIFLYYYFYQEAPQWIAQYMGLNTSAVYNRLSRGRQKLKASLGKEDQS
ncbi:sigma-70 family RNA polymerase sigma factor [Enterococcus sp. DIV0876]|uniref:sigma-70 family RNA polymerase sigma factor n=1 Tax=Enterococcus sp. DIV0876 TaxID=2774633 RepID=UPI003D2FDB43